MLKKRDRRGQITLFIILAILLILIGMIIFFTYKFTTLLQPEKAVLVKKGAVENYLVYCLQTVGEEALTLIGTTGGYIEIPFSIKTNNLAYLPLSPVEDIVIPYWAYGDKVNIPSLKEIKERVDDYIEKNLPLCLERIKPLKEYKIIEKSPISSNTEFAAEKTIFNVDWVLQIEKKDGTLLTILEKHQTESKVRFHKIYYLARSIMEKELETLRFEEISLDLIALEHPDVPLAGLALTCDKKEWDFNQLKKSLKDLLRYNLKRIKVENTDYIEFPENLPYYQNHYFLDTGYGDKEFQVQFNFEDNFPFSLRVTPMSENKLKSQTLSATKMVPLLCLQTWKFTYDLYYPVLVNLYDKKSDYHFNFAFTVHLIRNQPMRKFTALSPQMFLETDFNQEFCRERNTILRINTYQLIENKETGIYDSSPLSGVNLTFTCLKYSCPWGESEYRPELGDIAFYQDLVPSCVNAIIKGNKEGYKEGISLVSTQIKSFEKNQVIETDLNLIPLFKVNQLSFCKQVFDKKCLANLEECSFSPECFPLHESDLFFVSLIKKENDEEFHKSQTTYQPNIPLQPELIFLAGTDFTYQLEINLMKEAGDKVLVVGGYKGNWTVDWSELKQASEIEFPLVFFPKMDEEESFSLYFTLENLTQKLGKPVIK